MDSFWVYGPGRYSAALQAEYAGQRAALEAQLAAAQTEAQKQSLEKQLADLVAAYKQKCQDSKHNLHWSCSD